MKKRTFLSLLCALGLTSSAASARPVKALVLKQQSDIFGNIVSTISSGAIKIALTGRRVYVVAIAPSWRVMVCNDESKKAMDMTLAAWLVHRPQLNYMGGDWNRFGVDVSALSSGEFSGLPCKNYIFPAVTSRVYEPGKADKRFRGRYSVLAPGAGGLTIAADPICWIVQKALSCPKCAGVPLDFTAQSKAAAVGGYKLNLGGESHWLTTLKVEVADVDDKLFAYPVGYQPCPREIDVLKDDKHDAAVKSMFDDLLK